MVRKMEIPETSREGTSAAVLKELAEMNAKLSALLEKSTLPERRRVLGKCFVCDERGHFARACPRRMKQGMGNRIGSQTQPRDKKTSRGCRRDESCSPCSCHTR